MNDKKRHRILFLSKEDMAGPHQLRNAESLFSGFIESAELDLNDLLEYYNIWVYFDNDLYLKTWTESQISSYKQITDTVYRTLKQRMVAVSDETLAKDINNLDYDYYSDYWKLLSNLNDFKKIKDETFKKILIQYPTQIDYILCEKKLVAKYDKTIRDFLMQYSESAELLLSIIEDNKDFNKTVKRFYPKSLSSDDIETIVNSYLENERPNLNFVRLIENSKDKDLKLRPKTRLKARKRSKELNEEIFHTGYSTNYEIIVILNKDQTEPFIIKRTKTTLEVSYSEFLLNLLPTDLALFLIFKNLFLFTDKRNLITLVTKQSELTVFERTLMKSRNAYDSGFEFLWKEYLSDIQLRIFENYLSRKGKSLEAIVNSFISYLNDKIAPNKFIFQLPINQSSYLEKIRNLTPSFEFFLKQYKLFVEDNYIDVELLQISSVSTNLSEIYSKKKKKYLYSTNAVILRLKHLFYSDQSHLFYNIHFETKYRNLYDLLMHEKVKIDHFENYQIDTIQSLIAEGHLKLWKDGRVTVVNEILIYLIGEMHRLEVLSYWNYPPDYMKVMDELIEKDLVTIENTLLSLQERNYFNYYLNKKEFTDGFDLRNKYLHGTNPDSQDAHKLDYFRLLKLIILTLLKIDDDIPSLT